jgi:hypothetical protein
MMRFTAVCALCAAALAGCAGSRSVLYRGVSVGVSGKRTVVTDAAALRDGKGIRERWVADVARRGRADPAERFPNLSAGEFRRRLDSAAAHDHFTVKTLRFLHPREVAPLVVIQTRRYLAFARAVPVIEDLLDRERGRWRFEGFYLEGQDERGVPFVIVTNAVRGSLEGGQWARSDALFPFAHG